MATGASRQTFWLWQSLTAPLLQRHCYQNCGCRCKQAEILAGVCGQRESLERKVYEQDMQLELNLDDLETIVQVSPCLAALSSDVCMQGFANYSQRASCVVFSLQT